MSAAKKVRTSKLTPSQVGQSKAQRRTGDTYFISVVGLGDRAEYVGPSAEVYIEDGWLRIVSDPYDNSIMLNREIIPELIRTLRRLQKAAL